jgi:hypothetical protein
MSTIKFLTGIAFSALMFTAASCDKADKTISTGKSGKASTSTTVTSDNSCVSCLCDTGIDSAQTTGVLLADVGKYNEWDVVGSNFCGTGPQVTFEGQFNSIIRGADGWTVGYLNGVSYSTDLDDLTCSTVASNIVPTVGNFIGNENPTSCPTCPGYYNYSTGAFTRLVTASKCCPENGTIKTYVIKVTTLDAYSNDGYATFNSNVVYEYKCFTCSWTGTCPTTPASKTSGVTEHEDWKEIPAMFLKNVKK